MSQKKSKSEELYKHAVEIIPGGVSRNTIFRQPYPFYAMKATGCTVTDVDGVERIDFSNNMASLIHGHAHPSIVNAVTEQLKKGSAYTMATEAELRFADLITNRAKGFEKVRFMNSGTEAVMAMIKASRAYTGKFKIAKAEGAYHGTYDYAEISQTSNPSNWGAIDKPNSVAMVTGTPKGVLDDVVIFPFNDIENTLSILDRQADQIACVLIDPVPHRVGLVPATEDFIEKLYKWTRHNNALLIFDEVVTFRVNYGGAQASYSVTPDLTSLGKIIGGGFPVGGLTGRADVMKVLDPRESKLLFPHSGTFSANPVTMTAGRVAMELYDEEAVARLNKLTSKAISQVEEAIKISGVPVSVTGAGSMFRIHLKSNPPKSYREAYQTKETGAVLKEMIDHLFINEYLILTNTCACMFSTALGQHEADTLSESFLRTFRIFKSKLETLQ